MSHAQQVVYDLESLVFGGEVDGGDGADLGELGGGVVCGPGSVTSAGLGSRQETAPTFEEREDRYDARRGDIDDQLILPNGELLDILGETAHEPGPVSV